MRLDFLLHLSPAGCVIIDVHAGVRVLVAELPDALLLEFFPLRGTLFGLLTYWYVAFVCRLLRILQRWVIQYLVDNFIADICPVCHA